MNWTTTTSITNATEADDKCIHVEEGTAEAVMLIREMDSFGPVAGTLMCQCCIDQAHAAQEEEETQCHDCGETKLVKETISWKWFDFYAPEGDEPLTICHCCVKKEKHIQRIAKDILDYEKEMAHYC